MKGLRAILWLSFLPLLVLIGILPQWGIEPISVAQSSANSARTSLDVSAIATQVTVRIFTDPGIGSGAIVGRNGQTYTVLTNTHVVIDSKDRRYQVLTADGRKHAARWVRSSQFGDNDLALVQFRSDRTYQVVAIADSRELAIGDPVYGAGFPNWQWINSDTIEETRDWGTKAFRFTRGQVAMLPSKSLKEGYQLGYTNEIESGMSGGPVLDRYGRLIGINGRLKYPPQGINSFVFADGTLPSQELFHQMEALSWAVPTAMFRQALK